MERMSTDVTIVGAGPTGLMLAIELAMRGVRITMLDRAPRVHGQSRGGGVGARTCEVLAMRGLLDEMRERAVPRTEPGAHFAGLPVPLDVASWQTRHPDGLAVPQDRFEEVLAVRLAELGVTVCRATDLVALSTNTDSVEADVAGPVGPARLRSRYLVGCDGARSAVRAGVRIGFPGRSSSMSAVSADVELATAAESVPRTLGHISTHVRRGGGHWMLLHPLGEGDAYRAVFGGPEQDGAGRDQPVTDDEVARALVAVHGPATRLRRVRWATRFGDATRLADRYRHNRVLLAGDAAHIHSPIGGQGLNLGVQDAVNLGWKLAAEVSGHGPRGLLDTYEAERRPVAARVIALTRAQRLLMSPPPDSDAAELRALIAELATLPDTNRLLAGRMSGLDIRYDLGDPHPLVGRRMPDLELVADRPILLSTLQRHGAAVLLDLLPLDGPDQPPPPTPLPPGVRHVLARTTDPTFARSRVLVRPDGHVCWTSAASSPGPPAEVLERWFGVAASL
jgi:2-polyprenyl-6-methoxyphenol hydroxylase-like FAD-dependent oxidoreductase